MNISYQNELLMRKKLSFVNYKRIIKMLREYLKTTYKNDFDVLSILIDHDRSSSLIEFLEQFSIEDQEELVFLFSILRKCEFDEIHTVINMTTDSYYEANVYPQSHPESFLCFLSRILSCITLDKEERERVC